ncbi:acetaldehyde dehydrogenase (acetylating) [Lysinibacillus fusiformis]|uniref:acetaldehyde dehydrogenase (acetylating) n=1 Tax=Lysinibacillus fusiformis TaxID=28031 RepID=UPI00301AE222
MLHNPSKIKVAIIGSGKIGTDLLVKTIRSKYLECSLFVGRNINSEGIKKAIDLGVNVSDQSINALIDNPNEFDIVFDATSAEDHKYHASILKEMNKFVIDMTPAKIGTMCIPSVNLNEALSENNVNMVTCGGQASIPIAYAIGKSHSNVDYIEVISSISSKSAGAATRLNLDEYIETTELGLKQFSNAKRTKALLNLNPVEPCIDMQTTIFAKVQNPNIEKLNEELCELITNITRYVPGYNIIVPPMIENEKIVVMVKVKGLGDYLPEYAGNLDIINCAGIAIAEEYAKKIGVT